MSQSVLYPRGGGYVKNWLAAKLVSLGRRRLDAAADLAKINERIPASFEQIGEHYNDSFVFQGAAKTGEMFMSRLGFRSGGRAEPWVLIEMDGRKYVNAEPRLMLAADDEKTISAGGLIYEYLDADDQWQISFDGPLICDEEVIPVTVSLRYVPKSAMYLSSVHMDATSTGKAMAEMPWSRDYFKKLRSEHQVRIEQGASLYGEIIIGGERREVTFRGFRDHSWGKRNWTFIRRYIWNIFSLNQPLMIDGVPFEYICFTTVDYSSSFSHLVSGWIAGPSEVRAIAASSNMHELCTDGVIPGEYTVVFQPSGGEPFEVKVTRSPVNHSWMMQDGDFEVNEAYCRISLNGISGQGMSEFGFSRASGISRPVFGGR
ncbi:MAG: hypothetical protein JXX29_23980 [Deltaproteobacteria bacterium]|nr:hypothetical protein [Deltaproteobacteria bacterium]MBN2674762.1 hypothetical protein [Deltaproteobacteria bacterium]